MGVAFDEGEGDAVAEFGPLDELFVRQNFVAVEGEVSVLHLFSELALDAQVLLVGSERVGVVGGVAALAGPWQRVQIFLNFLVLVVLHHAVDVVQ